VDGLATRVQRPCGWANQKVLYDTKRRAHTAQGLSVATIWGELLWLDGGWPGSCHEHELIRLAGLQGLLDKVGVVSLLDRGSAGWPRAASIGTRRSGTGVPSTGSQAPSGPTTACRRGCGLVEQSSPTCQCLGAAPLARAAVPRPGRLPRRRRAHLPWPLAAPGSHMTRASRTPSMAHRPAARQTNPRGSVEGL
jgi:hypothetical protein